MTMMSMVAVNEPVTLEPIIEYVVRGLTTVGVPEITPVLAFKVKPVGSAGVIVYDVIVPPAVLGPIFRMANPRSKTIGEE